jgi:serine/threonine protein kinase
MDNVRIADRYEVVRPLGRGSFAQTLLAKDVAGGHLVAIKVLHPRAAHEWKAYELFEREAAVLRGLRHPGVPSVHEAFRAPWEGAESAAFLVMEYIEGESLADRIAQRRHFDTVDVVQLFVELLGVLDYLHTRVPPVLHRDIKPANIIVRPDGSPVLVDFGAVRNVFRGPDESGSTVVGSYGYAPYEQFMGQASASSDLYALGATFLHLVTGRAPPEFMTDAGQLEVPATLSCGQPLRSVLVRLLAPAPSARYQSAREARAALLVGTQAAEIAPRSASVALAPLSSSRAVELGPVPRPLTGETKKLIRQVGHSTWELMASTDKPGIRWGFPDWMLVGFFSFLTAGILPATFWSLSRARKKRLIPFLTHGIPATARIVDMTLEPFAFETSLTRVRYEFEADGETHRDSDQTLPSIAGRWDVGTSIQVLYLPDERYDSVIISTS